MKKFKNNVVICNTTPHAITIQDVDGTLVSVQPERLLNATAVEERVSDLFVTTKFVGTKEGEEVISEIEAEFKAQYGDNATLIIVGSIIAAQAYKGKVVGMTPVPGYERVAPAEKRMRCDKFTVFM